MKIALPLSLLLAAALTACSSTPETAPAPVAKAPAAAASSSAAAPTVAPTPVTPAAAAPRPAADPFAAPNFQALFKKTDIFFEYNSFEVQLDYFDIVEAHSKWAKAKKAKMLLQGNADERGSSEYNLALGQKRAEAVKSMLKTLGVPEDQVEAVSLGKEKPRNPASNEAAWAENRRVDIVYK